MRSLPADLFDGSGTIISDNDNWRSAQEAAITASGVAPTNDAEAALIGALPAGNYTAIVWGKNGGTGVGWWRSTTCNKRCGRSNLRRCARGNETCGGHNVGARGKRWGSTLPRCSLR